jgi:predicted nucleotidyltransferase
MLTNWTSHFHSKEQFDCVFGIVERITEHYAENLVTVAVFGSYSRNEARLNSDLDLFLVLKELPYSSRSQIHRDFVESVETPLDSKFQQLRTTGINMEISPIILSMEQAKFFNPLYYDMTQSVLIISDQNDFLKSKIIATSELMKRNGSEKIEIGGHWYWKAKSNPKFGEPILYEI